MQRRDMGTKGLVGGTGAGGEPGVTSACTRRVKRGELVCEALGSGELSCKLGASTNRGWASLPLISPNPRETLATSQGSDGLGRGGKR